MAPVFGMHTEARSCATLAESGISVRPQKTKARRSGGPFSIPKADAGEIPVAGQKRYPRARRGELTGRQQGTALPDAAIRSSLNPHRPTPKICQIGAIEVAPVSDIAGQFSRRLAGRSGGQAQRKRRVGLADRRPHFRRCSSDGRAAVL